MLPFRVVIARKTIDWKDKRERLEEFFGKRLICIFFRTTYLSRIKDKNKAGHLLIDLDEKGMTCVSDLGSVNGSSFFELGTRRSILKGKVGSKLKPGKITDSKVEVETVMQTIPDFRTGTVGKKGNKVSLPCYVECASRLGIGDSGLESGQWQRCSADIGQRCSPPRMRPDVSV